jgi:hypothetical protein
MDRCAKQYSPASSKRGIIKEEQKDMQSGNQMKCKSEIVVNFMIVSIV